MSGIKRVRHAVPSVLRSALAFCLLNPAVLSGCGPSPRELGAVDYAPLPEGDLKRSTPEEQGLDPLLLARLYFHAEKLETLYGLLVIKNGYLIAEKYFNEGAIDQVSGRQSATKSFTSALVGIALDQGLIPSLDQEMMAYFPELVGEITDSRKNRITIRQLLQMRVGIPMRSARPLSSRSCSFGVTGALCRIWSTSRSKAIRGRSSTTATCPLISWASSWPGRAARIRPHSPRSISSRH